MPPVTGKHVPLYLGLDIGTSGVRVLAVDAEGRIRAQSREPLPPMQERDVRREQDPQSWLTACIAALRQLVRTLGPTARHIRALAVDGTSGTLLLTDRDGRPLRPALMYNDQRAGEEAREIQALFPHNGALAGPASSLAKLAWLARREKALFDARGHLHHQADWLAGTLAGSWGWSDAGNVLKLGYDPDAARWPESVVRQVDALGVDTAWLPRVLPSGQPVARIHPERAAECGLPAETRIVSGTTDSLAALLAAGVGHAGQAATSLGSTLVLKLASGMPVNDPNAGIYSHHLNGLWLPGGASNAGGAALLRYFSREQIARSTARLDPGRPTGLHYYPLPRPGERFPLNDPRFAGRVSPAEPDPLRRFQALLEGIAYIEAWGYHLLAQAADTALHELFTLGGGTQNPGWMRIRANVLGMAVRMPRCAEAALGAAMLAAGPDFGTLGAAQAALRQPADEIHPDRAAPLFQSEAARFRESLRAGASASRSRERPPRRPSG